jgi:hypothetical protein
VDLVQAFQLVAITIAAAGGLLTILKGARELHRPHAEAYIGLTRDSAGSLHGTVQATLFNGGNRLYIESLVFLMGLPPEATGVRALLVGLKGWWLTLVRRQQRGQQFEAGFGVRRGPDLPKWLEHGESYRHFESLDPIADKADEVLAATDARKRAHEVMRNMRIAFIDGYGHWHEAVLPAAAKSQLNRWLDHRAGFEAARGTAR